MPLDVSVTLPVTGLKQSDFKPLPKDVYQVELIDVVSKPKKKFQSEETEDGLSFSFAVIENSKFYGRMIWQNTNLKFSTGKKSTSLFTVVSALSGKDFTAKDCENPTFLTGEYLNSFIGKQIRLSIGLQPGQKDPSIMYNTIDAYLPVKEMLSAFSPEKAKRIAAERMKEEEGAPSETVPSESASAPEHEM